MAAARRHAPLLQLSAQGAATTPSNPLPPPHTHRAPAQVFGVDVGFGQVVGSIAQEPRVTVMERTNLRHMQPDDLPCKVRVGDRRRR